MIVFGIDPGRRSGWAVASDAETVSAWGEVTTAQERLDLVEGLYDAAKRSGSRVHVCMEWVSAGGGGTRTAMGIGQARGRWLEVLELAAGYSERRVIRATPDQWRKATHGLVRSKAATREEREREYKAAAMAYSGIDSEDGAEAACIALHGWRLLQEKGV